VSYDSEKTGRATISAMQRGVVTDNADPLGLYRVRVSLPGEVDETDWAFPLGTSGGGSPQRGGFVVPAIGALVAVWFLDGDHEAPHYLCGHWGIHPDTGSMAPQPAKDLGGEAHKIASLQIGQVVFSVDERPDTLAFRVAAVAPPGGTSTPMLSIELDVKKQGIVIEAATAIVLRTLGLIHLDATSVRLRDRLLAISPAPV